MSHNKNKFKTIWFEEFFYSLYNSGNSKKKKKIKKFIHSCIWGHWGNIEIIFELDLKKILTYFYKYDKFEKFANFPMYIARHVHCNPVHLQYIYMSSWAR